MPSSAENLQSIRFYVLFDISKNYRTANIYFVFLLIAIFYSFQVDLRNKNNTLEKVTSFRFWWEKRIEGKEALGTHS